MNERNITKYNPQSADSIVDYGMLLLGHSLRELHPEAKIFKGKGGLGNSVEYFHYEYEPNSEAEPDFAEAGLELKCISQKKSRQDDFLTKERPVCHIIIRLPSSTIRQHGFPKTQILNTTYSLSNSLNHHTGLFLTNTRANVWNARYHQGNGNIVVQRLVHLSKLRASAPS